MFPSGCYIVNAGFVWRLLTWRIQARRTTAFGIHLPVDEGCELQEREFLKTRTSGKPTCTRNSTHAFLPEIHLSGASLLSDITPRNRLLRKFCWCHVLFPMALPCLLL